MNWRIIICILILFPVNNCLAQDTLDFQRSRLEKLFPTEKIRSQSSYTIQTNNELQIVLTSGYFFYKKFISTQDSQHCSFYPSCSTYALTTLQQNGFLGIFDAIDRLTRCNGFSPEKYSVHSPSNRFYDPVKKIH